MSTNLDLRQLVIEREDRAGESRRPGPPRHLLSRYVLPGGILLGFVLLIAWTVSDRLLPSTPVTIVPVVVSHAEVQQAGAPLFQAAGWIEPRPTSVIVSALAEGVIEKLLVVEGQEVQANQPVAKLIDTDARLALRKAEADLALRIAELDGVKAELTAAQVRLKQPVHLQAALAEAESLLAQAETELAKLPFDLRAAESRVELARKELEGKRAAGSAIAERLVQRAQSELDGAQSQCEEIKQREPRLQRVVATLRQKRAALAKQLELKVDETKQLADAESRAKVAETKVRQAELALETATIHVERMTVRSPVAGRVLRLMASPGSRLSGLSANSSQDSSSILSLYDPQKLQVRADVRLDDVARVRIRQPVRIETASASSPIEGEVLAVTSAANIQKNTLEVKIALASPPSTIRPEMLVQATFLAPNDPEQSKQEASRQRLLIPRQLVEMSEEGALVWIADPAGTARQTAVKLSTAGTAELVEATAGITPTDKLISGNREQLRDGQRIRITGEDSALGGTNHATR